MLTEIALKAARPQPKAYKLRDDRGLYILVKPNASRWWRWDYRRKDGTRNTLSVGVHPEVSLKKAREQRDHFRDLLRARRPPPSVAA